MTDEEKEKLESTINLEVEQELDKYRKWFDPEKVTEGSTIAITHDLIMYAAWSRVGDNSGTGIIYDSTFNFNHPKEIFTGLSKNITYTTTQYTTESIVSTNSPVIFGNGEKFDTRIKFKNIVGSFTKDNGTYTVTYTDDVVSNGDKTNLPFFRYTLGGE